MVNICGIIILILLLTLLLTARYSDDDSTQGDKSLRNWSGRLLYRDYHGDLIPLRGVRIEIWDEDVTSDDDLLACCITNNDGEFSIYYNDDDCWLCGNADVYLRMRAKNDGCEIKHDDSWPFPNTPFSVRTATIDEIDRDLYTDLNLGQNAIINMWVSSTDAYKFGIINGWGSFLSR